MVIFGKNSLKIAVSLDYFCKKSIQCSLKVFPGIMIKSVILFVQRQYYILHSQDFEFPNRIQNASTRLLEDESTIDIDVYVVYKSIVLCTSMVCTTVLAEIMDSLEKEPLWNNGRKNQNQKYEAISVVFQGLMPRIKVCLQKVSSRKIEEFPERVM